MKVEVGRIGMHRALHHESYSNISLGKTIAVDRNGIKLHVNPFNS